MTANTKYLVRAEELRLGDWVELSWVFRGRVVAKTHADNMVHIVLDDKTEMRVWNNMRIPITNRGVLIHDE